MLHFLIWIWLLVGVWAVMKKTPGQAFLMAYVPVLLLIPNTFKSNTPGIPDPSSGIAVMIPIFFAAILRYVPTWRISVTDVLVAGLAASMAWSEFLSVGYSGAQNLIFEVLFMIFAPYFVARLVVDRELLHVVLAKRIVFLLAVVVVIGSYQFFTGVPPFIKIPQLLFPDQGWGWAGADHRHGFYRATGSFQHAIHFGMAMIVAYRLSRWLQWSGFWEEKFSKLPKLPISKGWILTLTMLWGSLSTIARGPWLGGIIAGFLVNVARYKNRKAAFSIGIGAMALAAIPAWIAFQAYLDVKPGVEMTMSQETALYRKVLFEKYISIALDHLWFGWGKNGWPELPGMSSVDNWLLLLSLMHGLSGLFFFVAASLWVGARLFFRGMSEPVDEPSLAFTLMGIIIATVVASMTVYIGENIMALYFLILGWGESYLQGRGRKAIFVPSQEEQQVKESPQRFRRVIR